MVYSEFVRMFFLLVALAFGVGGGLGSFGDWPHGEGREPGNWIEKIFRAPEWKDPFFGSGKPIKIPAKKVAKFEPGKGIAKKKR